MENKELMGVIVSRDNLLRAYKRVVQNGGAAGVDGVETGRLAAYLRAHWPRVRSELLEGRYRPSAVRGVEIPKASGGKRLLGIPIILDRLTQQAVHQVLSPLWEPDFSPYSWIPPRAQRAPSLTTTVEYINAGYQDIIDLDLASFFDRVSHDKVMGLIRKKIADPGVAATDTTIPAIRHSAGRSGSTKGRRHAARRPAQPVAVQHPAQ